LLRSFIFIGTLSVAGTALAEPVAVTGEELQKAVSGSVVEIDTPLGTKVPMRFGKDGLVSAEAGVLAPVLGSAKDRGRWWVDGDQLCTKWFRWFDAGVRCLTIRQDGARIHWRKVDDGEEGTGTLVGWTPPKAEKPAVVAKAERAVDKPAAEKKPARKAQPPQEAAKPRKIAEPRKTEEKVAAVLPAREAEPVAEANPQRSLPPETGALRDKSPKTSLEDGPSMRFGGAGLLEASARLGTAASEPSAGVDAGMAQQPGAADERAHTAGNASAADSVVREGAVPPKASAGKKASSQRHAALERVDLPKRPIKRPPETAPVIAEPAGEARRTASLYRVKGVHRFDVLNVRRGPSESHAQIASIPATGRQVEITGNCRASWCPIRYGRVTGWVNSYYLAEERPSQASASRVYVAKP